jgi:hypothetical protein
LEDAIGRGGDWLLLRFGELEISVEEVVGSACGRGGGEIIWFRLISLLSFFSSSLAVPLVVVGSGGVAVSFLWLLLILLLLLLVVMLLFLFRLAGVGGFDVLFVVLALQLAIDELPPGKNRLLYILLISRVILINYYLSSFN